jgi:hypothetical protein
VTKAIIVALSVLFASPAMASETCVQVARALFTADPTFPQIVEASAQELRDWPDTCAATPPTGEGRVALICAAQTADQPIYFWVKESKNSRTLGFTACP